MNCAYMLFMGLVISQVQSWDMNCETGGSLYFSGSPITVIVKLNPKKEEDGTKLQSGKLTMVIEKGKEIVATRVLDSPKFVPTKGVSKFELRITNAFPYKEGSPLSAIRDLGVYMIHVSYVTE